MKTVPLSEAKDKLSALVEEADKTHEIIQITRHGHPSAVLMSADDLESLQETLHWLSQPDIRTDLEQARRDMKSAPSVTLPSVGKRSLSMTSATSRCCFSLRRGGVRQEIDSFSYDVMSSTLPFFTCAVAQVNARRQAVRVDAIVEADLALQHDEAVARTAARPR